MNFINCTPHEIRIETPEGVVAFPKSGIIPRVGETLDAAGTIGGIKAVTPQRGIVEGLPGFEKGTILIVSRMVFDKCPNRRDVVAPDTGPTAVRNDRGFVDHVTEVLVHG
jgi:hypothetical protein